MHQPCTNLIFLLINYPGYFILHKLRQLLNVS